MSEQKTYINPKFLRANKSTGATSTTSGNGGNVHINPNFRSKANSGANASGEVSVSSGNVAINPNFRLPKGTHLNPNPPTAATATASSQQGYQGKPHINPNFVVDKAKAKAYDEAIKKAVQDGGLQKEKAAAAASKKTVFVNPKFQQSKVSTASVTSTLSSGSSSSSSEKENQVHRCEEKRVLISSPATKAAKLNTVSAHSATTAAAASSKSSSSSSNATVVKKGGLFKMIGTRKLVRVNTPLSTATSKSSLLKTPVHVKGANDTTGGGAKTAPAAGNSSAFRKIGKRKLVRMRSASGSKMTPVSGGASHTAGMKRRNTDGKVYKVKTRQKIVKITPTKTPTKTPNRRHLFFTPLGFSAKLRQRQQRLRSGGLSPAAKSASKRTPFASRMFSQFKVDRRPSAAKQTSNQSDRAPVAAINDATSVVPPVAPKLTTPLAAAAATPGGAHKRPQQSTPAPPKPARKTASSATKPTTLINVQGVRYSVSDNGRKLKRLDAPAPQNAAQTINQPSSTITAKVPDQSASDVTKEKRLLPAMPPPAAAPPVTSSRQEPRYQSLQRKKFYLEGEEYVEDEPGILVRSRNSMTRASITSYKARSINTILKSQTRSEQYCMFFNKFGKCNKKEKGMCPYIHDPEKVAVCRKFLHGNCAQLNGSCLLSHKVAPEKMPSCKFFLDLGNCSREACPYRHVKVNDAAETCPDFLKGFCPRGSECKKKHEEVNKKKPPVLRPKKVPPAKPKRKSMLIEEEAATNAAIQAQRLPNQISEQTATTNSRVPRYYDVDEAKIDEDNEADDEDGGEAAVRKSTTPNKKKETPQKVTSSCNNAAAADLDAKRQRLMKRVELAKQASSNMRTSDGGHLTVASNESSAADFVPFPELDSPNDSGPYEKIEESDEEEEEAASAAVQYKRTPVGRLPSYISLATSGDDDDVDGGAGDVIDEDIVVDLLQRQRGEGECTKDIVLEAGEDCEERLI